MAFLRDVAVQSSEPARWAFVGARLMHGGTPEITDLLARIPRYPEANRQENILDFLAQTIMLRWFVTEAVRRDEPYLLSYATSRLALYAGRVFLAWNRMLYPFHKWPPGGAYGPCWAGGQRQASHRSDQVHNVCLLLTAVSYMIDMARFGLTGDMSRLRRYA